MTNGNFFSRVILGPLLRGGASRSPESSSSSGVAAGKTRRQSLLTILSPEAFPALRVQGGHVCVFALSSFVLRRRASVQCRRAKASISAFAADVTSKSRSLSASSSDDGGGRFCSASVAQRSALSCRRPDQRSSSALGQLPAANRRVGVSGCRRWPKNGHVVDFMRRGDRGTPDSRSCPSARRELMSLFWPPVPSCFDDNRRPWSHIDTTARETGPDAQLVADAESRAMLARTSTADCPTSTALEATDGGATL